MPQPDSKPLLERPQIYALLLLVCFGVQCLWVASRAPLDTAEQQAVSHGPDWAGRNAPDDPALRGDDLRSPLFYRIARLPQRLGLVPDFDFAGPMYRLRLRLRLPFILIGLLFGASVWYVARRLYTPNGALFALALFAFSPRMVWLAASVHAAILASWGYFGAIFLGIASAHALYALPETLPWHIRWRRPILMGIALGVAVAAQYSLWIAAPLALAFVLYLAPGRRAEGAAMMLVAVVIGALVLMTCFRFEGAALLSAWRAATGHVSFGLTLVSASALYPLATMLAIAIVTWVAWRRARYFGNTAALIAALAVPFSRPDDSGLAGAGSWMPSLAFLFLFVGGIFADFLETRRRQLVLIAGGVLLVAYIAIGLMSLAHV